MGSVVAGADLNPLDRYWGFWPLLPYTRLANGPRSKPVDRCRPSVSGNVLSLQLLD